MYEALRLAHRGLGWTSPNPPVGCVLVKDDTIVGRGWHASVGGLHAETAALADCDDPAGVTAYITLEPCSHIGKQPACTDELARAGIARVVYGCEDADSRSACKAAGILQERGIEVTAGVLSADCRALLLPYLHAKQHSRPHVHLKLAVSLDAKIACANGASQWLSGPESLGLAHYLRQQYDAVLVGRRTVVADDPRLTMREDVLQHYTETSQLKRRDPARVVIDPELRLLPELSTLNIARPSKQREDMPQLVIVSARESNAEEQRQLAALPLRTELISLTGDSRLDMREVMERLWDFGITSVLVEGGSRLASELIDQRAADHITLVYAPLLVGSDGLGFTPSFGLESLSDALRLTVHHTLQLGNDTVVSASFNR